MLAHPLPGFTPNEVKDLIMNNPFDPNPEGNLRITHLNANTEALHQRLRVNRLGHGISATIFYCNNDDPRNQARQVTDDLIADGKIVLGFTY